MIVVFVLRVLGLHTVDLSGASVYSIVPYVRMCMDVYMYISHVTGVWVSAALLLLPSTMELTGDTVFLLPRRPDTAAVIIVIWATAPHFTQEMSLGSLFLLSLLALLACFPTRL